MSIFESLISLLPQETTSRRNEDVDVYLEENFKQIYVLHNLRERKKIEFHILIAIDRRTPIMLLYRERRVNFLLKNVHSMGFLDNG